MTMARSSLRRHSPWLLVTAATFLLHQVSHERLFIGEYLAANTSIRFPSNMRVQLRAEGSSADLEERRAKCPLTREQLESDHGEKWEDVRDILVGLRATSPEAMMRAPWWREVMARYTALRFQDPQFLAATEKDETRSIRERNKSWSIVLGIEEMAPPLDPSFSRAPAFSRFDKLMNMNNDAFNLQKPVGFEVVSADGEWVEFKIKCCPAEDSAETGGQLVAPIQMRELFKGLEKTLSEKGRFTKDRTGAAREHAKRLAEEKQKSHAQRDALGEHCRVVCP
eukprot:Skav231994  [mRNA]  locus=scaffold719:402759:405766:- [translate_table: standard]